LSTEEILFTAGRYVYDNPEIIAGTAAGIGLYFTARALSHQQSTDQIKLAEGVFRDLRALEKEQSDINTEITRMSTTDFHFIDGNRLRADWRSRFFNTLEWLSFLINERKVEDRKVVNYFKEGIIDWYDKIFLEQASDAEKTSPKQWPELKKLYKVLKKGGRSRWRMKHETT